MINSLSELINKFQITNSKEYPKLIKQINIPVDEFKDYIFWSDLSYTRNCIVKTDKFELMLICWNKKQVTPIHNHGGEQCWVYQIDGIIEEIKYEKNKTGELEIIEKNILSPGRISYMDDSMGYHSLINRNEKALTLHLYMKPIIECDIFDEKTKSFKKKVMSYYTFKGKFN